MACSIPPPQQNFLMVDSYIIDEGLEFFSVYYSTIRYRESQLSLVVTLRLPVVDRTFTSAQVWTCAHAHSLLTLPAPAEEGESI